MVPTLHSSSTLAADFVSDDLVTGEALSLMGVAVCSGLVEVIGSSLEPEVRPAMLGTIDLVSYG